MSDAREQALAVIEHNPAGPQTFMFGERKETGWFCTCGFQGRCHGVDDSESGEGPFERLNEHLAQMHDTTTLRVWMALDCNCDYYQHPNHVAIARSWEAARNLLHANPGCESCRAEAAQGSRSYHPELMGEPVEGLVFDAG